MMVIHSVLFGIGAGKYYEDFTIGLGLVRPRSGRF